MSGSRIGSGNTTFAPDLGIGLIDPPPLSGKSDARDGVAA